MIRIASCLLLLSIAFSLIAQEPRQPWQSTTSAPSNRELLRLAELRKGSLVRVTDRPRPGDPQAMILCRPSIIPEPREHAENNPHVAHDIHIYITEAGKPILSSGKGRYPLGSVILKEKLPSGGHNFPRGNQPNASAPLVEPKPELFTGMLKREAGYNPECGDWEFFVVSGDAKQMLARGKIDSCAECHRDYKATDFVTRTYLPAAK